MDNVSIHELNTHSKMILLVELKSIRRFLNATLNRKLWLEALQWIIKIKQTHQARRN